MEDFSSDKLLQTIIYKRILFSHFWLFTSARFNQLRTQFFNVRPSSSHIPSIWHSSAAAFHVACCVDRSRPLVHFSNNLLATGINFVIMIIYNIRYHHLLILFIVLSKIVRNRQEYLLYVRSVILSEFSLISTYSPKLYRNDWNWMKNCKKWKIWSNEHKRAAMAK